MSSIANTLRSIVEDDAKPSTGVVQSASGNIVYVVTSNGVITAASQGGTFPAGSTVRIDNGIVKFRIKDQEKLPVYRV